MAVHPRQSRPLELALWVVQALLALVFVGGGVFKLITPITTLTELWSWVGDYPNLLRLTGVLDIGGGLGIVLPALTRIRPGLTALAALGCSLLMVSAIVFHLTRGEGEDTPINFILLALALFVWWGRRAREPLSM